MTRPESGPTPFARSRLTLFQIVKFLTRFWLSLRGADVSMTFAYRLARVETIPQHDSAECAFSHRKLLAWWRDGPGVPTAPLIPIWS